MAPVRPSAIVTVPFSPAMTKVLVTSVIAAPPRPVFGIFRPFKAGLFLTLSGVSPCGTCQRMVPDFRSMAEIREYGGFTRGSPLTVSAPCAPGARPEMYPTSERVPEGTSEMPRMPWLEPTYTTPVSGSIEPPIQLDPDSDETSVAQGPSALLTTGGVKIGPIL